MRRLVQRLAPVGVLVAGAIFADWQVGAAPISAPNAMGNALEELSVTERAQFVYLGRPYCWYPYGWAGAGWYWCGYGTRAGLGWGGAYGWNGWVVPRSHRAARYVPGYRFRGD